MDGANERSTSRKYLAKAFGNLYNTGLGYSPALYPNNILGPFRTAYNAGDVTTNGYGAMTLNTDKLLIRLVVIIYQDYKV